LCCTLHSLPADAPAAGGTTITIRGSNFPSGTTASIAGKNAALTLVDANTLSLTTPAMTAGPQHLVPANPDGETTTLDAALTANEQRSLSDVEASYQRRPSP
jgi:IPT/TIG domain